MDAKGDLYGTTLYGGAHGHGQAFELTPPAVKGGTWNQIVLYSFGASPTDAAYPMAGLIMDASGNLYGTAEAGGGSARCLGGCGAAFELRPPATTVGMWQETVLHSFGASATDGVYPEAALIMDAKGDLYGTTFSAGEGFESGAVFQLSPPATTGGKWKETVLHRFGASIAGGYWPHAELLMDASGNLYGTTTYGGVYDNGVVFELTP